jgi:hypothetical protein
VSGDPIRVRVEPERLEVSPGGGDVTVGVHVLNASTIVDEYVITAIGTGGWMDSTEARVRLFPDKEADEQLKLGIPAGRFVTAGTRQIGIQVKSVSNPSVAHTTRLQVSVAGVSGAEAGVGGVAEGNSLRLEPQVVRAGRSARLLATASNSANFPLNLSLTGEDPEHAVTFMLNPQTLTVPPGGQAATNVRVAAARPFSGTELHRQIMLRANGGGSQLSAAGTFIQMPLVTRFRLFLLRIVMTLVGALLMIVGALREWIAGQPGMRFTYDEYVLAAFNTEVPAVGENVPEQLVSLGLVAIVLAAVGLLGLLGRTGGATRLAGGFALVLMGAVFVTLRLAGFAIQQGLVLVVIGAGTALVAGLIGYLSKP